MSTYTTSTSSLKATTADIRNLDAKSIKLKGKPIIGELKDLRGDTATDNDIWPNGVQIDENGNATLYPLGYNKTLIPMQIGSGPNSVFKGNKIIDKNTGEILQWIDSDSLTAFPDGTAMTVSFYCESVDTSLNGIPDNANLTFDVQCKEFKVDMLNTNGSLEITNTSEEGTSAVTLNAPKLGYLRVNRGISEFNGDLSGISNYSSMFSDCTSLTSFSGNLGDNFFSGVNMFSDCTSLASFNSDLRGLVGGNGMFYNCTSLVSFNNDLSNLTDGSSMFYGCISLTLFNSDLSNLKWGDDMFSGCTNLTTFNADLSSLEYGTGMFDGCKLDATSLANIILTINTITDTDEQGEITIGLGIDDTDEARQALAEAIWCKDWEDVNQEFANKNWTVTWQFNGAPTE